MSIRSIVLAAVLAAAAPLAAQTPAPAPTPSPSPAPETQALFKLGQKLTTWFLNAEAESIYVYMSPESQEAAGGIAGIQRASADLLSRAGGELDVIEEKMNRRRGLAQFWHEANFESFPEPLVIRWLFDSNSKVAGVGLGPKSGTPAPDEGS